MEVMAGNLYSKHLTHWTSNPQVLLYPQARMHAGCGHVFTAKTRSVYFILPVTCQGVNMSLGTYIHYEIHTSGFAMNCYFVMLSGTI